jgi:hypothetical protein
MAVIKTATIKQAVTAKYVTTRDGDIEERRFKEGEKVKLMQVWLERVLVKSTDGHYFNLRKEVVNLPEDRVLERPAAPAPMPLPRP